MRSRRNERLPAPLRGRDRRRLQWPRDRSRPQARTRSHVHRSSLETLASDDRFDVITLFDVLEHIPQAERPEFVAALRERLVDGGTLFVSTPHPVFTHYRRANNDDTLQIVDEEVALPQFTGEAADVGLQLLHFRAFDVFRGSPEYQIMVFTTERAPGGAAALRSPTLERRLRLVGSPAARRVRRLAYALRLAARGRLRGAWWMLTGEAPRVRS